MNAIIREHMQQFDVSQGGGIISEKIRVDTIDNPMLVIGLGGTGIDALLRLKYQINRRFKLPEDSMTKKKLEKPDNIEFLAFETNEQDKTKKYKGIGLDPINELVLLSHSEIGSLLSNKSILEPWITNWLSPELNITDGINGACGNRQAGRLLLFTKAPQVVDAITKKINTLLEGTNKTLFVFILTGISGGTGSGCFLDISYIVRGIMEDKYGRQGIDKVKLLGYVFMPDVNLSNTSITTHTQEYIKKNGYAALKELDYWMNLTERRESFKQEYGTRLSVNSPMPPYDLCHLVSATNMQGKLLDNAYDYCMNVTAENITNFMASEDKMSGEEFAIHDYISNIETNIKQMKGNIYSANYKYNIIGAAAAVLPIEEITTFLGYKVLDKMSGIYEIEPEQNDVEDTARKLGLDIDSVAATFEKNVPEPIPGYQNMERFNYNNTIKTQTVSIDSELEQNYLARAREEYIKMRKQLPSQLVNNFKEEMNRIFQNPKNGPIYTSRLIFSDKGFCILRTIDSYIESLKEELARVPDQIRFQTDNAIEKMGEARSAIIAKDKKKNIYIETKIAEYQLKADKEKFINMIDFYEEFKNILNDYNGKIYNVFKEILESLKKLFEKNAEVLLNTEEDVDYKGNRSYYWNVVKVVDVQKLIEGILDEKDVEGLIRDFTSQLIKESDKWINENEIDIVGSVAEFLSDKFGELITKSMEEFLAIKYGKDQPIDQIVERTIAGRLNDDAIPVFHLSNSSGRLDFPSYAMVSVPTHTPSIYKGIKNFQEHNAVANSNFKPRESKISNRIFWINTKNGVPLYAYTPLKTYEKVYEDSINTQEGIGRHLVQAKNENWVNLPSPIPEESWGDVYTNSRVKHWNNNAREIFKRGLEFNCIKEKEDSENFTNKFEYLVTDDFNVDSLTSKYSLWINENKPNYGEVSKCMEELRNILKEGFKNIKSRNEIFKSYSKDSAEENFLRYPTAVEQVKNEIKKYEAVAGKLEEFEGLLKQAKDEEGVLEEFIKALYTKVITKKGALYIYDKEEDEEPWQPFMNIMEVKKYPEYELFKRIKALDDFKKNTIKRRAEKRDKALVALEDVSELTSRLDEILNVYGDRKEKLEDEMYEIIEGKEIYSFYKKIVDSVKERRRNLD